jgi:hypothetical protein
MEKVAVHLAETTGDGSIGGLEELLQQVAGAPAATVQGVVACMLKFQGVKLSEDGVASAHSHGHLSVGTDDLTVCTSRIHETVGMCLRRVGAERVTAPPRKRERAGALRLSTRFGGRCARPRPKDGDTEDVTAWDTPKVLR